MKQPRAHTVDLHLQEPQVRYIFAAVCDMLAASNAAAQHALFIGSGSKKSRPIVSHSSCFQPES
jgi:hypothetical protein